MMALMFLLRDYLGVNKDCFVILLTKFFLAKYFYSVMSQRNFNRLPKCMLIISSTSTYLNVSQFYSLKLSYLMTHLQIKLFQFSTRHELAFCKI